MYIKSCSDRVWWVLINSIGKLLYWCFMGSPCLHPPAWQIRPRSPIERNAGASWWPWTWTRRTRLLGVGARQAATWRARLIRPCSTVSRSSQAQNNSGALEPLLSSNFTYGWPCRTGAGILIADVAIGSPRMGLARFVHNARSPLIISLSCVFSREVCMVSSAAAYLLPSYLVPEPASTLAHWWLQSRKWMAKPRRAAFDSVVLCR
jgi:hypothetical protein